MRRGVWVLVTVLIGSMCVSAENADTRDRRHRAATAFHDGILLVHAKSQLDGTADGFRQDPCFYYFTGLQNTVIYVRSTRARAPSPRVSLLYRVDSRIHAYSTKNRSVLRLG
jgi:hypothetical protein